MAEQISAAGEVHIAKGLLNSTTASVSAEIRSAAAELIRDSSGPGSSVGQLLNAFLGRFLPWPYRATPGRAFDSNGAESLGFASLIYTSSEALTQVPADTLACAIDVHQTLGLEELRVSYEKIAQTKRLAKSPLPKTSSNTPVADATMGVIVSIDSSVPLERLAEELEQLNKKHSYRHWVDVVVVLTRGTINYVCQFPYRPLGDWLPPARDVAPNVPMYLHIIAKPHAAFSLNRMCAFLFTYLHLFSPGTTFPPFQKILEGSPNIGMTIAPYQFNLKGELVPVPMQLRFNQFFVFPLSFRAEDGKGNILSKVQYMPWQDGGVVRTTGKLPIEAFLVFGGKAAIKEPIFRLGDEQISSVLPLSHAQFIEIAERTARQSNLVIRPEERPKWVVEKIGDEGTNSPFIARLFLGILRLRDQALSDATQREQFDKAFEGVAAGLQTVRAAAKSVVDIYSSYSQRVARGEIARITGGVIYVDVSVDQELRKQTEIVISTAGRVVKDRMQEVLRSLNLDIGFFYRKPTTFTIGIAKLRQQNDSLAAYLDQTRTKWSERLKNCRDALEHESWVLPKILPEAESGIVRIIEPLIDGQPVTEFVTHMVDRVCCFVEDLCAHALQARMLDGVSIREIPLKERNPEIVERFQLALVGGGMSIWSISYHDSEFEET
jgi:hypothetical protein